MIQYNCSLLTHNTFGLDVKANTFIEYGSVDELKRILLQIDFRDVSYLHIGQGSNLLFIHDYQGIIFHSRIRSIEMTKENDDYVWLRVGAGVIWDDFVDYCVYHQWSGAENLSLIPGEVGASAIQNIGAYGVEVKDIIDTVEVVEVGTGRDRFFENIDCRYTYRQSIFKNELKGKYFVTYVTYRLNKRPYFNCEYGNIRAELEKFPKVNLQNIRQAIIHIRNNKLPDPKIVGNAGSFFMNPIIPRNQFLTLQVKYPDIPYYELPDNCVKIPAGWMIDKCGWKGKSLGPVAVHDKQALVLVNMGGAKGEDILCLSDAICRDVQEMFGIAIHPEVNVIE
jgi:UDP-N-acetylmuramate dehydrogenase